MRLKTAMLLRRYKKCQRGATAIEYGILAALAALAIVVGVDSLSTQINTVFSDVATEVANAG
jgi:pilus assembly protein Flp/PilA